MNKEGKRPVSMKPQGASTPLNLDDIFGNPLGVHPDIDKALKERHMVYRWINATQVSQHGGWHPRHWRPLKISELKSWGVANHEFLFGQSEDGFVRRGDTVLGVRSVELNEKHKTYLRQVAKERRANAKAQGDKLRQMVRESGLPVTIEDDESSD